mgnify:CR=1 FL=1
MGVKVAKFGGTSLADAGQMRKVEAIIRAGESLGVPRNDDFNGADQEGVGYYHMAHAFVRGNWRNEAESNFMLLAKSCHDLDWISYVMGGAKCEKIASFGYDDCPGHATWMDPIEWLGSKKAERFPLHMLSDQPKDKLHSQLGEDPLPMSVEVQAGELVGHVGKRFAAGQVAQCLAGLRQLVEQLLLVGVELGGEDFHEQHRAVGQRLAFLRRLHRHLVGEVVAHLPRALLVHERGKVDLVVDAACRLVHAEARKTARRIARAPPPSAAR